MIIFYAKIDQKSHGAGTHFDPLTRIPPIIPDARRNKPGTDQITRRIYL